MLASCGICQELVDSPNDVDTSTTIHYKPLGCHAPTATTQAPTSTTTTTTTQAPTSTTTTTTPTSTEATQAPTTTQASDLHRLSLKITC